MAGNLSQIGRDVLDAAGRGGFDHADAHIDRLPLALDCEGFEAAARELEQLAGKLRAIAAASAARLAADEAEAPERPVLAVTMLLEAPAPEGA